MPDAVGSLPGGAKQRREGRAPPAATPCEERVDEERTCISDSDDDPAAEAYGAGPSARSCPNPNPDPDQGPGARPGAGAAAAAAGDGDAAAGSAGRATAERPGAAASRPAPAAPGGRSVLEHGCEVARRLAKSVSASVVRAVGGGEASCEREARKAGPACAASAGLGSEPGTASSQAGSAGASAAGVDVPCVAHTGSASGSGAARAPDFGIVGKLFAGITSMSPAAEALGHGAGQGSDAAGTGGDAAQTLQATGRGGRWGPPSPGHRDAPGDPRRVSLPNPFVAYKMHSPRMGGGGCIAPNPSICPGFGSGAAGGGAEPTPAALQQMTQRMQHIVRQHSSHSRTAKVRVLLCMLHWQCSSK